VIRTPTRAAIAEPLGSIPGTVAVSPVAALTESAMSSASIAPTKIPAPEPSSPRTRAPVKTKRPTWPRVAPAARRRPTSRARSPTVIDSVLTIRKAPTKRTTAATSAAVAWKSAEEARRLCAIPAGDARTYGSVRRLANAVVVASALAPGASSRSTRVTPSRANAVRATPMGTTTVRPGPPSGPKPATIPTTLSGPSLPAPSTVMSLPSW